MTVKKTPLFIVFEGIDGSGKSTQAAMLAQKMEQSGLITQLTCEPTKGPIGKMIRQIFSHHMQADERTVAALFAADRIEHLVNEHDGIISQLNKGISVVTDRYYFSSFAYHSVHCPMDWVIDLNRQAINLLRPHITIFIDLQPDQAMQRLYANRDFHEKYETLENLNAVYHNYLSAFKLMKDHENVLTINGNRSMEAISGEIWDLVTAIIA